MANKQITPTEAQEQEALFAWSEWTENIHPKLAKLFHIPNEGKRSKAYGASLKRQGLKSGVPDICLPVARGGFHGLFIELKRVGGRPTEAQKRWISMLTEEGYKACVCEGWEQAAQVIINYLRLF